ncbi:SDR family NAD(P)-dependent oxidoreductase [Patescibacteria group bacterium]|nr:SDR family NAD(P)-dependent oxidoreductase [Patescibacteria group bacterium]
MNNKFLKYFKEYKWSNIFSMIKNNRLDPKICDKDFKNKLVVITGATSGIGYSTANKYASKGANLLCINRNPQKSEKLKKKIESKYSVKCDYILADLSNIKDIEHVAEQLLKLNTHIDVFIHNAGIYLTKKQLTQDGLDMVFVVNYLSSFLINYLLMDKLKNEGKTRILLVGSEGHRFAAWGINVEDMNFEKHKYSAYRSYGLSKTAQILSMHVFNKNFRKSGVTINTMHPGAVRSDTGKENGLFYRWFKRSIFDKMLDSPKTSAEALYYLGVSNEIDGVSGKFFNKTTLEQPAPPALDKEVAEELWRKSIEIYEKNK